MDSQPPRTIGRYRVVRTLGSGGMGTVYLAEDPALKRAVALKVVQGGLREQKQALARFRREAEISARLNHPNVITIHDVGEDPAVGPFITMEFVDGQSLAGLLRERTLPLEIRLALLVQAARALHAAHEAGIVHRDVKPQNLMISRDGRVKLMDFGVARSDESTLTMTGAVLGTPAYMAPEQIDGVQPSIGTDTYAFAVLVFEALCGQRPYTADTVSKLLYQIAHEPPSFPPGLDPKLRTVLEQALSKSPASRFDGPKSFLQALIDASPLDASTRSGLRAGLESEDPLSLRTGGAATAARPAPRGMIGRHVRIAAAAAIAFLALGAALAGWLRTPSAPEIAATSEPAAMPIGTTPPAAGPASLRVPIRTDPPGAEVFLDERFIGRSPLEEVVVPRQGEPLLRLRLEGYEDRVLRVERDGALPDPIRLVRVPEPPAPEPAKVAPVRPAEPPAATRSSTKRSPAPRLPPPADAPDETRQAKPDAPAAPPSPKGEDPGFWRNVGKGFGNGFRELGHGFKRFGENVGDAFRREDGEE